MALSLRPRHAPLLSLSHIKLRYEPAAPAPCRLHGLHPTAHLPSSSAGALPPGPPGFSEPCLGYIDGRDGGKEAIVRRPNRESPKPCGYPATWLSIARRYVKTGPGKDALPRDPAGTITIVQSSSLTLCSRVETDSPVLDRRRGASPACPPAEDRWCNMVARYGCVSLLFLQLRRSSSPGRSARTAWSWPPAKTRHSR